MKVQKNDAEKTEECRSIMNAGEARQNGRMIRQTCKRSSLGNRAMIVVMEGISEKDPLVLQVKEAQASVLENYLGKSSFAEHGRRVVEGQRAIQTAGDILLGWARIQDADGVPGDYYVRQLWDAKGSVNLEKIDPEGFSAVASMCAWTLAHAHAKTGDRHGIAGYLGRSDAFDEAMLRFARAYADQNERDFEVFCASN